MIKPRSIIFWARPGLVEGIAQEAAKNNLILKFCGFESSQFLYLTSIAKY